MKLVACYQVFNEEDYIEQSIKSIYAHVDKIVIYEVCYKTLLHVLKDNRYTSDYLSGDDTSNIIMSVINNYDKDKKIKYYPIGLINYDETNTYGRIFSETDVGDYIWLIGGDEVYTSDICDKIRDIVDHRKYSAIWLYHLLFWHDFWHIKTGGHNNLMVYEKVTDKMFYAPRHMDVQWRDSNGNIYGFQKMPEFDYTCLFEGRRLKSYLPDINEMYYFHYAYVRSYQRLLEKIMWQYYMMVASARNDEYYHSLNFETPLEFKLKTFPYFTASDPHTIRRFPGPHPEIMRNHKFYDLRWDEKPDPLTYEQALQLVNDYRFGEFEVDSEGRMSLTR